MKGAAWSGQALAFPVPRPADHDPVSFGPASADPHAALGVPDHLPVTPHP